MEEDRLWERFAATGRVEDYLTYCGVIPPKEEPRGTEDRRTDRPGEQQRRGG